MESAGIMPTVLTGTGVVAAVLLGVWGIVARYDSRLRNRIDAQDRQLRDRLDAHGREITEQLGQLGERMAKLEALLEGLREAITGKRAA